MEFSLCKIHPITWFDTQSKDIESHLHGFIDVDYVVDCDKIRSPSDFMFSYFDILVSWRTSLQYVVSLSTIDHLKYIAAAGARS